MITLYTCITNNKDAIVEQDFPITRFIDAYDKFKDPRRNSRIQKIMPHKYFETDYSIYMDGNMKLLISPGEVIDRYMKGVDMALLKHGGRDCIYDEAMTCAKLGLDDPEIIIEQAKYYEDHEFVKHKGLLQGGFIVRKHNLRTERFNEAWWADYCRFSRRDQLSLMPAIEKSGVIVNTIPEHWIVRPDGVAVIGDILEMTHHQNFSGNFNEQK
jgi:hypothetical protein